MFLPVTSLVYNLVHDVDVQKTQRKLDVFRAQNKDLIERNLATQVTRALICKIMQRQSR